MNTFEEKMLCRTCPAKRQVESHEQAIRRLSEVCSSLRRQETSPAGKEAEDFVSAFHQSFGKVSFSQLFTYHGHCRYTGNNCSQHQSAKRQLDVANREWKTLFMTSTQRIPLLFLENPDKIIKRVRQMRTTSSNYFPKATAFYAKMEKELIRIKKANEKENDH